MAEAPINLSTHQVRQLLDVGHCIWQRRCEPMAALPYANGERLWGRESVYKPRKGEADYLYRADGEQPGRYPQCNYHMPRTACRLRVEVVGAWYEQDDGLGQWATCFTLKRLPDAVSA